MLHWKLQEYTGREYISVNEQYPTHAQCRRHNLYSQANHSYVIIASDLAGIWQAY